MNKLYKLVILTIAFLSISNSCYAFSVTKFDKIVSGSKLNDTATIAISVKNVSNSSTVYEKNANKLLHPASTLKTLTAYFAINTLGYDYQFKTGFYTDDKNNLYIKLGADPLLRTSDLKAAFQNLKEQKLNTFSNLYIDDSILDKKEFSDGWMWDDEISPYTPKISSYNLDGNTIKINFVSDATGSIKANPATTYPMSVFSNLRNDGSIDYLSINRYNWNNPELIEIYGNIRNLKSTNVPISSMRRYFIYNLDKIIEDNRINIKSTRYASKLLPQDAKLLYEISHPITAVLPGILQNSNNLMAETIFKLAGGYKYNTTGNDKLAIAAMKDFLASYKIYLDTVEIRDGSGVSRNNLVSANWMNEALSKIYRDKNFDKFKDIMAEPGDGTLSTRLYDLRCEAWFKTGSLSNISGISGFINSRDGNTYAVTIFIQNFKENQKEIKDFEDELLTLIYNR